MNAQQVLDAASYNALALSESDIPAAPLYRSLPDSSFLPPLLEDNSRVSAQLGQGFGSSSTQPGSLTYSDAGAFLASALPDPRLKAGAILGGQALDAVGGFSGAWQKMRSLFGSGDYQLKSNSLIAGGGRATGPIQITPQGNRAVRIVYREYIGDVYSHPTTPGAFWIEGFPINPGSYETFKWLPPIAAQFEQWTPNGIVFEFKSTSSEYVSNQALGSVIMATEYDLYDQPYVSKVEMLNSAYANEAKPSDHIIHGIECNPRDNPQSIFYVRTGALSQVDGDLRDYDLGRFYVATQGIPFANANLGSLYVHYDITFRKEQLYGGIIGNNILYYAALFECNTSTQRLFGDNADEVLPGSNFSPPLIQQESIIYLPPQYRGATWMITVAFYASANMDQWSTPYVFNSAGVILGSALNPPMNFNPNTLVFTCYQSEQEAMVSILPSSTGGTAPSDAIAKVVIQQIPAGVALGYPFS